MTRWGLSMAEIKWTAIRNQSLALAAREAGYDLTMFHDYSRETQAQLPKSAIRIAMRNLDWAYEEETDRDLSSVKKGVYVISISNPFTIQYDGRCSEIIYIGIGAVRGRLESHFKNSLFEFMMSVAGANFDFRICEPKRPGSAVYYKHIEYLLLNKFAERIGDGDYPLLNKNAGSNKSIDNPDKGWDTPLKASGKKPIWQIEPTKHWAFSKLD